MKENRYEEGDEVTVTVGRHCGCHGKVHKPILMGRIFNGQRSKQAKSIYNARYDDDYWTYKVRLEKKMIKTTHRCEQLKPRTNSVRFIMED